MEHIAYSTMSTNLAYDTQQVAAQILRLVSTLHCYFCGLIKNVMDKINLQIVVVIQGNLL
jgi:hypothetical protein